MPASALTYPTRPSFPGFGLPEQNWFKLPNDWTDITAGITSLAELKVVEYVLKHTWGYREYGLSKRITTDEFMYGRKRKDGARLDRGTGLSNRSVIDGLRRAVEEGYLIEEVDDSDKARIKKYYALRMNTHVGDSPPENEASQVDVKNLHSGVKNLPAAMNKLHSSSERSSQRTEQDTLARQSNNKSDPAHSNAVVVVALMGEGIGEQAAKQLANQYTSALIFEKIDFLAYLQATHPQKVKSPHGWLRRAIEENYGPPDGYKPKAAREVLATAEKQRLQAQERLAGERKQQEVALTQQQELKRLKRLETLRQHHHTSQREDHLWRNVLKTLQQQVSEVNFKTYLAQSVLLSLRESHALIAVPNGFIKQRVEERLVEPVQAALAHHLAGRVIDVQCQSLAENE